MEAYTFRSRLRLGLTLIIVLMVISSPILIFSSPISISAKSNNVDTSGQHSAFSLEGTSSTPLMSPSPTNVSPMDSDFTTQAALSLTRASQTNNFVASKAYYDISFRTATAGVIKSVVMDFPTGTSVGSALVVEATGIGPGTLAASAGEVLTYTVTNAVNVPANTIIRIQISNINNPPTPSASLTVSITTRDAASVPIDGPTPTLAYNMVQVGNAQIAPGAVTTTKIATGAVTSTDVADGAITSTKPAESFMKRVTVLDNGAGSDVGWNPNGGSSTFTIIEPDIGGNVNNPFFTVEVTNFLGSSSGIICAANGHDTFAKTFNIDCNFAPPNGAELHYVVGNLPEHTVQ